MPLLTRDDDVSYSTAPKMDVPKRILLNIEHPGLIISTDSALQSLGGDSKVQQLLSAQPFSQSAELNLHGNDPFHMTQLAESTESGNIVLKITVPTCTGKRKRGSNAPFIPLSPNEQNGSHDRGRNRLLRSLKDNTSNVKLESIGRIKENHSFRKLPDFNVDSSGSKFADAINRYTPSHDNNKLWRFRLDTLPGSDMVPPPVIASENVPFPWAFRQNPYVDVATGADGKRTIKQKTKIYDLDLYNVRHDAEQVPNGPKPEWVAEATLKSRVQHLIGQIRLELRKQPIMTKRLLHDQVNPKTGVEFKTAIKYCGYYFTSGPWHDSIVRYGYDPRLNPDGRHFQTMTFRKDRKPEPHSNGSGGTAVPNTYQTFEITDPLLRKILDSEPPRETCAAITSGWFNPAVWAKVRIIMRDKLATGGLNQQAPSSSHNPAQDSQPPTSENSERDREYLPLANLPNNLNALDLPKAEREKLGKDFTPKQMSLLKDIRTEARRPMLLGARAVREKTSQDRMQSMSVVPEGPVDEVLEKDLAGF